MPAILEPPVRPQRLYRYRKLSEGRLDRELDAIESQYLWCSQFNKMNDPMEGFFRRSTEVGASANYKGITEQICADNNKLVGIASLSDTNENELMWAHYAENYMGICIAYETIALLNGLPSNVSLVRLGYDDQPPQILGAKDYEVAKEILSQKKGSWAYEREWRVLAPSTGRVDIKGKCITHIYLGAQITEGGMNSILERVGNTDIAISAMKVDGYKHVWDLQSRA